MRLVVQFVSALFVLVPVAGAQEVDASVESYVDAFRDDLTDEAMGPLQSRESEDTASTHSTDSTANGAATEKTAQPDTATEVGGKEKCETVEQHLPPS
jgi:hypothetical protein